MPQTCLVLSIAGSRCLGRSLLVCNSHPETRQLEYLYHVRKLADPGWPFPLTRSQGSGLFLGARLCTFISQGFSQTGRKLPQVSPGPKSVL